MTNSSPEWTKAMHRYRGHSKIKKVNGPIPDSLDTLGLTKEQKVMVRLFCERQYTRGWEEGRADFAKMF
jgi:hypothetical protein